MSQQEIEVILARHLAEYLAMPIFIVNPDGDLIFYNEPAEAILGTRYSETGSCPPVSGPQYFIRSIRQEIQFHRGTAARHRADSPPPGTQNFLDSRMDGAMREIEVSAVPLIAQANRFLGGIAIFWEISKK